MTHKQSFLGICVGSFLLFLNAAYAVEMLSPEASDALRQEVIEMQAAFDDNGDISLIMQKTHPSIIALLGGQDAFEQVMVNVPQMLEAQGIELLNTTVGEPTEIYIAGNEEVVFLPRIQELEIAAQNFKLRSTSYLIAARKIGSDAWLFMDGSGLRENPEQLWTLLPDLPKHVVLPESTVTPFE